MGKPQVSEIVIKDMTWVMETVMMWVLASLLQQKKHWKRVEGQVGDLWIGRQSQKGGERDEAPLLVLLNAEHLGSLTWEGTPELDEDKAQRLTWCY